MTVTGVFHIDLLRTVVLAVLLYLDLVELM